MYEDDNASSSSSPIRTSAKPTTASDMYSVGVIIWEIFCRQVPWKGLDQARIIATLMAGKRLPMSMTSGDKYYMLPAIRSICTALFDTAEKRPSAAGVLEELNRLNDSL